MRKAGRFSAVFAAGGNQIFNRAEIGCKRSCDDQRTVCKNLEGIVFRTGFACITRQLGDIAALEDADLLIEFVSCSVVENGDGFS